MSAWAYAHSSFPWIINFDGEWWNVKKKIDEFQVSMRKTCANESELLNNVTVQTAGSCSSSTASSLCKYVFSDMIRISIAFTRLNNNFRLCWFWLHRSNHYTGWMAQKSATKITFTNINWILSSFQLNKKKIIYIFLVVNSIYH